MFLIEKKSNSQKKWNGAKIERNIISDEKRNNQLLTS